MIERVGTLYRRSPIGSVQALARALGIDEAHLRQVASSANEMYRGPILVEKKGKLRSTFDALPPLKRIHNAILRRILDQVEYPDYLMGGIRDTEHTRGYIRNAVRHSGSKLLVGEDVADYFPSISSARVRSIFLHVFRFPPPVSAILTDLCTKAGVLPQGAKTSSAIANLVLYRLEPALQRSLEASGIEYSRFIDDVHASTRRRMSKSGRTQLVRDLRGVLIRSGFTPKRSKQFIASRSHQMKVHNLNVNNGISRDRGARKALRMELHILRKRSELNAFGDDFQYRLARLSSKIAELRKTNPSSAPRLAKDLSEIKIRWRAHITAGSLLKN